MQEWQLSRIKGSFHGFFYCRHVGIFYLVLVFSWLITKEETCKVCNVFWVHRYIGFVWLDSRCLWYSGCKVSRVAVCKSRGECKLVLSAYIYLTAFRTVLLSPYWCCQECFKGRYGLIFTCTTFTICITTINIIWTSTLIFKE